jgi:PAS domain S-box-containing protein
MDSTEVSAHRNSPDVADVFDNVDLSIVLVDPCCVIARFNRAAAITLGLSPADISKPLAQIRLLTNRSDISEQCARVINAGDLWRGELKDDDKWFVLRITALPRNERPTVGAILTFTNVTVQRESIAQALYERQFTKTILNTVMQPIAVLDADLSLQTANRAFLTMFQVSREELIGQTLSELKHHTWANPQLWTYLKDAFTDQTQMPFEFDHAFPTLGQRTILVSARRLDQTNHAGPLILLTLADITEEKQALQALLESEQRYRILFESMEEGYCVIEMVFDNQNRPMDYRFLVVNPAFERQTGIHEATGRSMREIAPTHEQHWFDTYGQVALSGEPVRFENHAAALNRWYEVFAFRVGSPEQRRVGLVFNDITRRRESDEALRQLNTELESRVENRTQELTESQQRLRALATELNLAEQRERQRLATDLHDYLGQLLVLSRMKLSQAKKEPMGSSLQKFFDEVLGVTDKALSYTRTLVSQLSPPVLHEFGLSMALQWLAEQMHQRELLVTLECKRELPWLPEDQSLLLFQSVRELLLNSVRHAQVAEALVEVDQIADSIHITVSDHGCGFNYPAGVSAQGNTDLSTGFGLFSIRERMLSLGGRFDLQSEPGKGTVAKLILPVGNRTCTPEAGDTKGSQATIRGVWGGNADAPNNPSTADNGPRIRIVVTDDHAMVRQGLRSLLDQYSDIHIVGEAANGEEALALADRLLPDVMLMDITMPKMNGVEATSRLKRKHPGIVVIGLSIHTAGQVEAEMREAGAAAFINKEAAVDELYEAIHAATKSIHTRSVSKPRY